MKKPSLSLAFTALLTLSFNAQALELLVVKNYQEAANPELWKKAKTDQVPAPLLGNANLGAPGSAYAALFPNSFLQEDLFVVCHKNCAEKDIFSVSNGQISPKDLARNDVIEQSNVYYYLKDYFTFLDKKLGFRVDQYLKVTTNRQLRDETKGKKLKNNAFFNPLDVSLSFLPATNNLLFKLLGGKINRSGFDPSVVVHEASHYLFHHLFPNSVNEEIGGLNEGFADYMANIYLNSPKLGLVMMHGQTLRDSSAQIDKNGKLKSYEPNMEVHDLGERVSYALWKTREVVSDKDEMDRMVIDAVADLSRNPYSSVHDFKVSMLERLNYLVASVDLPRIRTLWELTFTGSPIRIANLSFMDRPASSNESLGFRTRQVLPENLAREYGTSAIEESNFVIIRMEQINTEQLAILMGSDKLKEAYWVVLDLVRGNTLGIFSQDKRLIEDDKELAEVKFLADKAKGAGALIKDFTGKLASFTDLSRGKGDFNIAYKVKSQTMSPETVMFNGISLNGLRLRMNLKRRLLTGLLLGLPEIEGIELVLAPVQLTSLPEIDGRRVIGYKLLLKTGTATEVILDRTTF